MPNPGEHIDDLWKNPEGHEKRGPLFDVRSKLSKEFQQLRELTALPYNYTFQDGYLISPKVRFSSKENPFARDPESKDSHFTTKALLTDTEQIHIGLQQEQQHKDEVGDYSVYDYILNPDGSVVRTDELDPTSSHAVSSDEALLVEEAAKTITSTIESDVSRKLYYIRQEQRQKEENRRNLTKRVLTIGGAVLGVGILAGGAGAGWYYGIHLPGVAEDAHRAEYDSEGHAIDGEAIELDTERFVAIPAEQFQEIPHYRGGDSLENPRIVSLDTEGCVSVEIDTISDKSVRIGVAEGNQLSEYSAVAFENNDQLKVCTTESPSVKLAEDNDNLKIAVQLTN